MSSKEFSSGSAGDRVRSDCFVKIKITEKKGVNISVKSKVDILFGRSIKDLVHKVINFYQIKNCEVEIDDKGALPFVIMARMEAAIRGLGLDEGKRYLPDWNYPVAESSRDRFRRSRLYLPGDQPKLFINAAIHYPDGIILDLEDSVSPESKDAARLIVRNALRAVDFMNAERMVRINQLPLGLKDLEEIVPQKAGLMLLPKIETADQIHMVDSKIDEIQKKEKISGEIFLMPIIESALGIINAYSIASSSEKIVALAIGLEDYTADIGTKRTNEGKESFFARSMIVNAAKAVGIQAIDTVFSDVSDMEGLKDSVLEAKALGFNGKGCIHPRQISVVHEGFAPTADEITMAKKIVKAFEYAEKTGLGVVSLGSKMIDPPVVKRALHTIDLAVKEGLINESWRDDEQI